MTNQATRVSRDEIIRWARDLYENSVDRKDAAGFAAAFVPDGWVQFGNNPRISGRDAIREAIAQFFTAMIDLRHTSKGAFIDGNTVILEAEVTYTRHDRKQVTVPAVTIFRMAEGQPSGKLLADQCRIYVDLTPLFAPSA